MVVPSLSYIQSINKSIAMEMPAAKSHDANNVCNYSHHVTNQPITHRLLQIAHWISRYDMCAENIILYFFYIVDYFARLCAALRGFCA